MFHRRKNFGAWPDFYRRYGERSLQRLPLLGLTAFSLKDSKADPGIPYRQSPHAQSGFPFLFHPGHGSRERRDRRLIVFQRGRDSTFPPSPANRCANARFGVQIPATPT